jgi:hypothetical protein
VNQLSTRPGLRCWPVARSCSTIGRKSGSSKKSPTNPSKSEAKREIARRDHDAAGLRDAERFPPCLHAIARSVRW